jgi:hypothetical protein
MRFPRLLLLPLLSLLFLGLAGCLTTASSKKKDKTPTLARFMLEVGPREAGARLRLPISNVNVTIVPKALFTEYDIVNCEVANNEFGKCLVFQFSPEAGRDLYRLTVPNQGKRIVTLINGEAMGARMIEAPIAEGYFFTYIEVPEADLAKLAADIKRSSEEARKELEKKR